MNNKVSYEDYENMLGRDTKIKMMILNCKKDNIRI